MSTSPPPPPLLNGRPSVGAVSIWSRNGVFHLEKDAGVNGDTTTAVHKMARAFHVSGC